MCVLIEKYQVKYAQANMQMMSLLAPSDFTMRSACHYQECFPNIDGLLPISRVNNVLVSRYLQVRRTLR